MYRLKESKFDLLKIILIFYYYYIKILYLNIIFNVDGVTSKIMFT